MGNFESHSGSFQGLDLEALNVDEAYVILRNNLSNNDPAYFFSLSEQCVGCLPKLVHRIDAADEVSSVIDVKYDLDLFAGLDAARSNFTRCSNRDSFLEFGVYNCGVSDGPISYQLTCTCVAAKPGANIFWPILCCLLFYLALLVVWIGSTYLWRKYRRNADEGEMESPDHVEMTEDSSSSSNNKPSANASTVTVTDEPRKQTKRIKSIDTFRGVAISLMIFVNYGGGDYSFFDHAPWNGLQIADLVFPWFMWLMGVCIPIAMRSLLRRKSSKSRAFLKVIKRSMYLFFLGLALNNSYDPVDVQMLRIFGVLQRFGITYLIIASLHLAFLRLNRASSPKKYDVIKDFVDILPQWLIVLMIVAIHLMVTLMLQFNDCPRGYLGPGGRHESGQYVNCTGGANGYIDRVVLGYKHLYQRPTFKAIYDSPLPFDPEGLMSTFQAVLTVFLGVQAGMILITYKEHKDRIVRWLVWAVITGAIGTLLCKASKDDGWIPVNKNLWSVSYVLVTASLAFFLLTFFYYLVDMKHVWSGSPFFYPGMNSILLYVGHQLTDTMFPWRWMDSGSGSAVVTHGYQLVVDLWGVTLWVAISVWLYNIKFFLAL